MIALQLIFAYLTLCVLFVAGLMMLTIIAGVCAAIWAFIRDILRS